MVLFIPDRALAILTGVVQENIIHYTITYTYPHTYSDSQEKRRVRSSEDMPHLWSKRFDNGFDDDLGFRFLRFFNGQKSIEFWLDVYVSFEIA